MYVWPLYAVERSLCESDDASSIRIRQRAGNGVFSNRTYPHEAANAKSCAEGIFDQEVFYHVRVVVHEIVVANDQHPVVEHLFLAERVSEDPIVCAFLEKEIVYAHAHSGRDRAVV